MNAIDARIESELRELGSAPRGVRYTNATRRNRQDKVGVVLIVGAVLLGAGQLLAGIARSGRLLPDGWEALLILYGIVACIILAASEIQLFKFVNLLRDGIPVVATVIRRSDQTIAAWSAEVAAPTNQVVYAFYLPNGKWGTGSANVSQRLFDEWQLDGPLVVLVSPDGTDYIPYRLITDIVRPVRPHPATRFARGGVRQNEAN